MVARADARAFRAVRSAARPPEAVVAARRFSRLGEHAAGWLVLGAVAGALDTRRRDRWWRGAGTVAAAYLLNTAVKLAVGRRRPLHEDLPALVGTPTNLSFPSAHATSSFAAARAYSALAPAPPLYAVAGAMAFSRVYLGVHYPSDVAAGALLGMLIGSVRR